MSGWLLKELGPGGADAEQGDLAGVLHQVAHEGQGRLAGPVQVLEDDHRRRVGGDDLEEALPGGEVLLARSAGRLQTEQRAQAGGQPLAVVDAGQRVGELGLDRGHLVALDHAELLLDDLAQRPERQAVAVGRAAALAPAHDGRTAVDVAQELEHESRLAYAGLADDHRELRLRRGSHLLQQPSQDAELDLAVDERRRELLARVDAHARDRAAHQPALDRGTLALHGRGVEPRVVDRARRERLGGLAHDDAHRRRQLLQTGGRVDGVADQKALAGARQDVEAHHGHAGVDADPHLLLPAGDARQVGDAVAQAQRGVHGPLGVVFVGGRHAEDADHGVADVLLDDAAEDLDGAAGQAVELAQAGGRRPPSRPLRRTR